MKRKIVTGMLYSFLLLVMLLSIAAIIKSVSAREALAVDFKEKHGAFLQSNGVLTRDYPTELLELLARNPETQAFVLNYPLLKDKVIDIDLREYKNTQTVPLLMQWDTRWGYRQYGNTLLGISGCGPTCLSMVAIYLLGDIQMDPAWMADFSTENGFCVPGNGTAWALMSEGAEMLGLGVLELPLEKSIIAQQLQQDHPIICIMGPGDFTTSGHFIVLTGWQDGKLSVNDPNSAENSARLWDYDRIKDQIRNLWAYSVANEEQG